MSRSREITPADQRFIWNVWRFRGYLSRWGWEDGIYPTNFAYALRRPRVLESRGFFVGRWSGYKRWRKAVVFYLAKKGVEFVGSQLGWTPDEMEREVKRWEAWRNDEWYVQARRLYLAELGRKAERAGWQWRPKYEVLTDEIAVNRQLFIGGGLSRPGHELYLLYVVDSRMGRSGLASARNETIEAGFRSDIGAVIVLCLDRWSYLKVTPAGWNQIIVPYDYALEALDDPNWIKALENFRYPDYVWRRNGRPWKEAN